MNQILQTELDDVELERPRIRVLPDGRMTRGNAAAYLGYAEKTLAIWIGQGKGPKMIKVGGRCFYYKTDLDEFIQG
jgi:hypothetical protein